MSIFGKIRFIDLYKKVPHDLTEGTYGGAILSIACTVIMVILFISSLSEYLSSTTASQMLIDDSPSEEKLPIIFSIEFFRTPCSLIFTDNQDILGFNAENVHDNIVKRKVWNGTINPQPLSSLKSNYTIDEYKTQILQGEGCLVEGKIYVNKVPGNIHFSVHNEETARIVENLTQQGVYINYAHKILQFSFGLHEKEARDIQRMYPEIELLALQGTTMDEDLKLAIAYQYYLNVVRAKVLYKGEFKEAYQYTVSKSYGLTRGLPSLFFKYEMSPLYVRYELKEKSIWHFIVNICAIIGGVYTAFSILDAVIYTSVSRIFKSRIGKLG